MLERSDIDHPLWRKKIDATFLKDSSTPIPNWLLDAWNIKQIFGEVRSKNDEDSLVAIHFNKNHYKGHVTKIKTPTDFRYRLHYDVSLMLLLREVFLMSYMRALEGDLQKNIRKTDIEKDIPFWEFIDIEFDADNKLFKFVSHYHQQPLFPELFKRLVSSAPLKIVHDEITNKEKSRIHKQDWRQRSEYKNEIGAENVIYTLLDTHNKFIYVGEASKMIRRFDSGHDCIKDWNYYKYNVLPREFSEHRLTLERMAIRDMASILINNQDISTFSISEYKLVNNKIDK